MNLQVIEGGKDKNVVREVMKQENMENPTLLFIKEMVDKWEKAEASGEIYRDKAILLLGSDYKGSEFDFTAGYIGVNNPEIFWMFDKFKYTLLSGENGQ